MCDETEMVFVKIPADLSCDGEEHWKHCKVDKCIVDIVRALQVGGIDMRSSCCGHGEYDGSIQLQDGRTLMFVVEGAANERFDAAMRLAEAAHELVHTQRTCYGHGSATFTLMGHPNPGLWIGEYTKLRKALIVWQEVMDEKKTEEES